VTVATTGYRHVELDERGVPVIASTRFKVALLIEQTRAYGWNAEEAREQHPQLTLAQIYSALAYYHDHRDEIDAYLAQLSEEYDEARRQAGPSPLRARLEQRLRASGQR
jgi:uncharacterized protein (DUF433 family)